MSFSIKKLPAPIMYSYFSRRRALLFKGLLLVGTVWLTVAVLILMENRDKVGGMDQPQEKPRHLGLVYDGENEIEDLAMQQQQAAELEKLEEEDPLQLADGDRNEPPAGDDVPARRGVKLYGEYGKPVILPKNLSSEVKKLVNEGWQKNAFNQYVSDLVSLHRQLPDPRDSWCKKAGRYLEKLPQTSVIICFHNEAWSVLLRTVHSVLDRSPPHLLKEIILIDDFSDMPHLKRQLEEYMSMYPKVKIIRAAKREGLIRARLIGAKHSTAPVLTYLDSHCECTVGWLEPLLDRIARDSSTVVCPVIDVIDDTTLEYHWRDSSGVNVGGFDWNLQFNWHGLPDHEKKRHKNSAEPVYSPTMAGGLFSIDKKFFERLGTYDSGFDIWGGENLELSFKTWMCGGTLEIVPCSHVGHIFRKRSPYKWRTGVNVLKKNSIRLAKVWMDEYAKYYFQRIGNEFGDYGDISSRVELRKKLKCKSFKWYLDNVYPELFIPDESVAQGEIRNMAFDGLYCLDSPARKNDVNKPVGLYTCHKMGGNQIASEWGNMCIDSACRPEDVHKPVNLWPCHKQGGNQYWLLSKQGEIRRDEMCIDYAGTDVFLFPCHGSKGNQLWIYKPEEKLLQHGSSKKCLAISEHNRKLVMESCNSEAERQRWNFENYNATAVV